MALPPPHDTAVGDSAHTIIPPARGGGEIVPRRSGPGAGRRGETFLLPPVTLIWDAVGVSEEPYHFRSLVLVVNRTFKRSSGVFLWLLWCHSARGRGGMPAYWEQGYFASWKGTQPWRCPGAGRRASQCERYWLPTNANPTPGSSRNSRIWSSS